VKSPVAKVMAGLPSETATMFPELPGPRVVATTEVATQHHAAKSLAG
jgi:hypothetical protein